METRWKTAFKTKLKSQENEYNYENSGKFRGDWGLERMYTREYVQLGKESELGLFFDLDDSIRKYSKEYAEVSGTVARVYEEYKCSELRTVLLGDGKAPASRLSPARLDKCVRQEIKRRVSRYFTSCLD
jgi:hypothetical protein